MSKSSSPFKKLRVIIAGGRVAALETALALADLAPDRTDVTVVAPNTEFVYRPMVVREHERVSKIRISSGRPPPPKKPRPLVLKPT